MKKIIILFISLAPLLTIGQESANKIIPKRNTIYLEAYGQGCFNSLSFDRLYRINKKIKSSFTAGVTLMPLLNKPDHILAIGTPVSYNWLFGQKKHHFELGVGLTFLSVTNQVQFSNESVKFTTFVTNSYVYFTPKISYRFQNPNGGLFFRVSFTPPIALYNREGAYKQGNETYLGARNNYLLNAVGPIDDYRIFPWPGLSVGYTLK
ncbi:MAG TPA: hypothetical protein VN026_09010 [Bacteroidia bacterium]|nr:hypothetical protein [Bacteroidia bacterium]